MSNVRLSRDQRREWGFGGVKRSKKSGSQSRMKSRSTAGDPQKTRKTKDENHPPKDKGKNQEKEEVIPKFPSRAPRREASVLRELKQGESMSMDAFLERLPSKIDMVAVPVSLLAVFLSPLLSVSRYH